LWIRAADRAAPPDGEFYHDALIGCRVETTAGKEVGTVSRVEGPRGMSILVVKGEGAREVLVPLAEAICPVIDPAARRIVIDPPEGLLDLND
jgi:16S rRNA processing protein RimM